MQIYQSTDPLDAPDFDPVSYINEQVIGSIFNATHVVPRRRSDHSSEYLLTGTGRTDRVAAGANSTNSRVKIDAVIQVREQSQMGRSAEADVDEAKQTISDLYGRIVEIKEKAAHSEELVQVICKWCFLFPLTRRSISKLDAAKRNLTESLNALARLQMYSHRPLLT